MEYPELAAKLRPVRHYDGLPLDAQSIVDRVHAREGALTR
jgi:hypothetical protein